jgi:Glycosyltransferase family 87
MATDEAGATPLVTSRGAAAAFTRLWQPGLFAFIVVAAAWGYFSKTANHELLGFDFRGTIYDAARDIASGNSPYPAATSEAVATGNPAVYPPLAPLLAIPLTWLGWDLALAAWIVLLVAGVVAGMWLLGVSDWRCFCVVLASLPVLHGVLWGNLTLLLLAGVGAAWRYRDRAVACGAAVALLIAAKLFLWPLLAWLVLTRRLRAAAWASAGAVVAIVLPWAVLGFRGFADYPALLRVTSDLYGQHTSSVVAVGAGLGVPLWAARLLPVAAGVVFLLLAWAASRRPDADRRVFAIAVLGSIAASPIVWDYYLVLLVAPVAVLRPRLSWLWLALPAVYAIDRLNGDVELTAPPPHDAFLAVWGALHSPPPLGPALGVAALLAVLAALTFLLPQATPGSGSRRTIVRSGSS